MRVRVSVDVAGRSSRSSAALLSWGDTQPRGTFRVQGTSPLSDRPALDILDRPTAPALRDDARWNQPKEPDDAW